MPKCPHCGKHIATQRTTAQSNALHLFYTMLSEALNNAGLDMRTVLKESYDLSWTPESVKAHLWKPIQKAMYGIESTRELTKTGGEIQKIHETIMRGLAEKFGLDYIEFPNDPDEAPLRKDYKLEE
jgi:hypothetical protein